MGSAEVNGGRVSKGGDLIAQLISNLTSRVEDPRLLEKVRREAAHRVMAQGRGDPRPAKLDDEHPRLHSGPSSGGPIAVEELGIYVQRTDEQLLHNTSGLSGQTIVLRKDTSNASIEEVRSPRDRTALKFDEHGADCTATSNASFAVNGLLRRLLPLHVAKQFRIEHCPLRATTEIVDFFEVHPGNSTAVVHIRGSSGVALASGVRHYLRLYANTSFSWWGDNLANLPMEGFRLPVPPAAGVRRNTTLKYRFALNSCVFGYTTPVRALPSGCV